MCLQLLLCFALPVLMKWVMMLGPAKVASICTDDVAGLAAARSLLPSMPRCNHIVQYRQAVARYHMMTLHMPDIQSEQLHACSRVLVQQAI